MAPERGNARRLWQVFFRSIVIWNYLTCATAGDEVELNKSEVNLECEVAVMWLNTVL